MIILGIDPGTQITGYGLIQIETPTILAIDFGCILPPASLPLAERYRIIFESLQILMDQHKPEALAVESQFVLKNAQSAIKLGMAKGMAILAAAQRGIPIYEYAPTRAKLAVVGRGHASKWQVQKMIKRFCACPRYPEPEDAGRCLGARESVTHKQKTHYVQILLRGTLKEKKPTQAIVECGKILRWPAPFRALIPTCRMTNRR